MGSARARRAGVTLAACVAAAGPLSACKLDRASESVSAPEAGPRPRPSASAATMAVPTDGGPLPLPPLPRNRLPARSETCNDDAWASRRLDAARSGRREILRVPYSITLSADAAGPTDALCSIQTAELAHDARLAPVDLWRGLAPDPRRPAQGRTQKGMVEGWLEPEPARLSQGEGADRQLWTLLVLDVWHVRPFANAAEEQSTSAAVVAVLDDDELFVPRLHDARSWLLVAASLPYDRPDVDDEAERVRGRARAAGFAEAEVVDSRQTATLSCCSRVVLAGRWAAKWAADEALGRARAIWPAAFVQQGW